MNQTAYAFGVSYIRAIENKLLTKADIENLILAKTNREAIQLLLDKGYGSEQVEPERFEDLLKEQLAQSWGLVREVAPEDAPLDVLIYKNDFQNYKVALKGILSGKRDYAALMVQPATVEAAKLTSAVADGKFDLLPLWLRDAAMKSYDVLTRTMDSQLADSIIDKASMDHTMNAAAESGSEFLMGYIRLHNTLTDIKIAVRCAKTEKSLDFMEQALSQKSGVDREGIMKAALSGEGAVYDFLNQTGFEEESKCLQTSMAAYETLVDNQMTQYVKNAKYITFGVEPLVAYLYAKQLEILTVRQILSARLNGFGEEQIRGRLRELYV